MNESKEFLGEAAVTVRFEYEPERPGRVVPPNGDASVWITEICIGGVWVSAALLADDWLLSTERLILAEKGRSLQAEYEMAAWEAQQEANEERGYP